MCSFDLLLFLPHMPSISFRLQRIHFEGFAILIYTLYHDDFVYKAYQYHSVTEYMQIYLILSNFLSLQNAGRFIQLHWHCKIKKIFKKTFCHFVLVGCVVSSQQLFSFGLCLLFLVIIISSGFAIVGRQHVYLSGFHSNSDPWKFPLIFTLNCAVTSLSAVACLQTGNFARPSVRIQFL